MLSEVTHMNEEVLKRARELLVTSEYLFDIACEIAEDELYGGDL